MHLHLPLAVSSVDGLGKRFWLNVLLDICGFVPGVVHGIYVTLDD